MVVLLSVLGLIVVGFREISLAKASDFFTAAEFFETVTSRTKRGAWPSRVSFKSVNVSRQDFELRGVWRVFVACSGRPISADQSRGSAYADGYHIGANLLVVGEPDIWSRMKGRKLAQALPLNPVKKLSEFDSEYTLRPTVDEDGSISVDLNGSELHTYQIREQAHGEIILMAERSYQSEEFRGFCKLNEVDQFLMVRIPEA